METARKMWGYIRLGGGGFEGLGDGWDDGLAMGGATRSETGREANKTCRIIGLVSLFSGLAGY